ncbi:MAG: phage holin family protein [Bacteroidetes bacterium]|nr:phage holin family protein [Bacteroidota bacterium]
MFRQLEEIRATLLRYLETRIELFQLEQRDRIEQLILKLIYLSVGAFLLLVIGILAIILLAVGLNVWLESRYAGYLIVLGFFMILALLWFLFRPRWLSILRVLLAKMAEEKQAGNP